MISTKTLLRHRRRPSCTYRCYCRWALPLLRLCGRNNSQSLLAFSPPTIRTAGILLQDNPFIPARVETSTTWLPTPNINLLMSRRSSPRSRRSTSSTVLHSKDELQESPSRKRKNKTDNPCLSKDWSSLKVVELKEELTKRGLKTTGKKADLVSMLEEDDLKISGNETTSNISAKKKKTAPTSPSRKHTVKPTAAIISPKRKPSPTRKAADHQRITNIDVLPKLWNDDMAKEMGSYTFKIASWNVAGLRALVRKMPNALAELCQKHDLDMLCLQETKLQEGHLEDPKLKLKGMLDEAGYDEYWSCSTVKKGYSGTCVFVKRQGKGNYNNKGKQTKMDSFFGSKKKDKVTTSEKASDLDSAIPVSSEVLTPTNVGYSVEKEIDNEGRVIVLEFPWATIANVYVPNSGQKLERLDYRTKEWDNFFLKFMQDKQNQRGLPVIWLGDLNIAHRAYDIWNDGAKHLAKQAGVTEQERKSFTAQLDAGFVDVFRRLHPDAKGNYSYWSQRAGNREPNKGLRLDYFMASDDMFHEDSQAIPRDSYMIMNQMGSDHAPVVLEIEIKGSKNHDHS